MRRNSFGLRDAQRLSSRRQSVCPAFRKLDKLIGDGWRDAVHPEDRMNYAAYVASMEARRSYQAEYRVRRADGEYRWVLDTARPRFLPDGAFAGYIGIAMDITDL